VLSETTSGSFPASASASSLFSLLLVLLYRVRARNEHDRAMNTQQHQNFMKNEAVQLLKKKATIARFHRVVLIVLLRISCATCIYLVS
jgi:hypothetical protein